MKKKKEKDVLIYKGVLERKFSVGIKANRSNELFEVTSSKTKEEKKSSSNRIVDPNSADFSNQLLKENLKKKFAGYDYGLSDW